jgi:hypothetical protein
MEDLRDEYRTVCKEFDTFLNKLKAENGIIKQVCTIYFV